MTEAHPQQRLRLLSEKIGSGQVQPGKRRQVAGRVVRFDSAHLNHEDLAVLARAETGVASPPTQIRHLMALGRGYVEASDRIEGRTS